MAGLRPTAVALGHLTMPPSTECAILFFDYASVRAPAPTFASSSTVGNTREAITLLPYIHLPPAISTGCGRLSKIEAFSVKFALNPKLKHRWCDEGGHVRCCNIILWERDTAINATAAQRDIVGRKVVKQLN